MPLDTEVNLGRGDFVLVGEPAPPWKELSSPPPSFGPCLLWPRLPISATAELLFVFLMHDYLRSVSLGLLYIYVVISSGFDFSFLSTNQEIGCISQMVYFVSSGM